MSEHQRDDMGICIRCGQGITAVELVVGERPCTARTFNNTPAPALTDEQFDTASAAIRECFDGAGMREVHDTWVATVIDRAKREERAAIADAARARYGYQSKIATWIESGASDDSR